MLKQAALELGLNVLQPLSLRKACSKKEIRSLHADVMIVAAYGLILPQSVLDMPRLGCLNIHASLLPRWRGAAPIHRAIEAGDKTTGITIMQMDAGLDTGDMLSIYPINIESTDTSQSLHDKLRDLGADAIVDSLEALDDGKLMPLKQNESIATYAHKLHKKEAFIDWSQDAISIARKVRAFNPWPCAFTKVDGKNLKIWHAEVLQATAFEKTNTTVGEILKCVPEGIQIQTGDGILNLLEVQLAGKKRMSVSQFVNAIDLTHMICAGLDE